MSNHSQMPSPPSEYCIICKRSSQETQKVYPKGLSKLITISTEKNELELRGRLMEKKEANECIHVHRKCRLVLYFQKESVSESEAPTSKRLRSESTDTSFNWKSNCFLCSKSVDTRHRRRHQIHQVETIDTRDRYLSLSQKRNDEWGNSVLAQLLSCIDLVAVEAVYHQKCSLRFQNVAEGSYNRADPTADPKLTAFENFCRWFECECVTEMRSVQKLHEKMREECGNSEVYSLKTFRDKIKQRYGGQVYFISAYGRNGEMVCFKNMSDCLIRHFQNNVQSKEDIINTAGNILKEDIKNMEASTENYPSPDDICAKEDGNAWIPESLTQLMKHLIPSAIKRISINQCIVQAVRPRSIIAPIPFGIGVSLDKSCGSQSLSDLLSHVGFSITSDEIIRFKQSAAEINKARHQQVENDMYEGAFVQWVGDNVDHNTVTLTGKGSFHGMGIISVCNRPQNTTQHKIPRLKERLKADSFSSTSGIPIIPYNRSARSQQDGLILKPLEELSAINRPTSRFCDLLWHSGWFFSCNEVPRPHWFGFLQSSTHSFAEVQTKSVIDFLPIIDLNPNDETCIYSTLKFILQETIKMKLHTACVTFDQPLWLKAMKIINAEKLSIVCRLGGFHTLMSFVGSICNTMKGSGLEELFEEVYSPNTIPHICSGKAISKAVRALTLSQSALMVLRLEEVVSSNDIVSVNFLKMYYEKALARNLGIDDIESVMSSQPYRKLCQHLKEVQESCEQNGRTQKLWSAYMKHVDTMRMFITAERSSDWELHLYAISKMINLFSATGHGNYAKSARLYLQEMQKLPEEHPLLYEEFTAGQHTVRRTERAMAGIWTDLSIEQTLMRTIKTRGGLTQGRGFKDSARHLWTLSSSTCAHIYGATTQFAGTQRESDGEHAELGTSRRKHDFIHCCKFYDWLKDRSPFMVASPHLHSLSTGLVSIAGKDNVSCERAEEIGVEIQKSFDNTHVTKCSIKRRDLAVPMSSLYNVKKDKGTTVPADTHAMFGRLISFAGRLATLESAFEYELTNEPMALFKNGMMRRGNKSQLKKALLHDPNDFNSECINSHTVSVIDGGALLHRVRWVKGTTFEDIAATYINYMRRHYNNSTVVFDGYEKASIKDQEHMRRYAVPQSSFVNVGDCKQVPFTQPKYLSMKENKIAFIKYISQKLTESGIQTFNCRDDADTEIVRLAIMHANEQPHPVLVVADDTDIAVMLLYHWNCDMRDIILLQERTSQWWSIERSQGKIHQVKDHLLFLHAFSGCDSTSAIFGQSKNSFLKKLRTSSQLQNVSNTFTRKQNCQQEVGEASITAFRVVYGAKNNDTLAQMRYSKYVDMTCSPKGVSPERLPPTERSAYFHGLRVRYQIMRWVCLSDERLMEANNWGWRQQDDVLLPITTDMDVAPELLKRIIRCKCDVTTKKPCSTRLCTCRKYGMPCLSSCSGCRGRDCSNCDDSPQIEDVELSEESFHEDADESSDIYTADIVQF